MTDEFVEHFSKLDAKGKEMMSFKSRFRSASKADIGRHSGLDRSAVYQRYKTNEHFRFCYEFLEKDAITRLQEMWNDAFLALQRGLKSPDTGIASRTALKMFEPLLNRCDSYLPNVISKTDLEFIYEEELNAEAPTEEAEEAPET